MPLNKYRNQPCPCKSGMKFKHCCLQGHYHDQEQLVTPIQRQEGQKAATYWRKRYAAITSKPLDEPLMGVPSA